MELGNSLDLSDLQHESKPESSHFVEDVIPEYNIPCENLLAPSFSGNGAFTNPSNLTSENILTEITINNLANISPISKSTNLSNSLTKPCNKTNGKNQEYNKQFPK